jgi:hypothetical protein
MQPERAGDVTGQLTAAARLFMGSPWVERANAVVADVQCYERMVDAGEVSRAIEDRLVGMKTTRRCWPRSAVAARWTTAATEPAEHGRGTGTALRL